jgi:hypothetical protein
MCRTKVIAGVAGALRERAPAEQRPSELSAEASLGAVWGIVCRCIVAGRARGLQRLAPMLAFLVLVPAIGGAQAVRGITAEHARMFPHAATDDDWGPRAGESDRGITGAEASEVLLDLGAPAPEDTPSQP